MKQVFFTTQLVVPCHNIALRVNKRGAKRWELVPTVPRIRENSTHSYRRYANGSFDLP